MPTYQYACTSCGDELEVVQSFTDDALTDCPACETGRLRKLFGSVGVVFKGSGFYRTDSRADGRSSGGSASSSTSGSSSSGGDSTTGSKDSSTGSKGAAKAAASGTSTTSKASATSAA